MNIFENIHKKIADIIHNLAAEKNVEIASDKLNLFTITPSKDKSHGDLACNAALILAKDFKISPKNIAQEITSILQKDSIFKKIEIAGVGFINLTMQKNVWYEFLVFLLNENNLAIPKLAKNNDLINIEYASPNPTGPMHVGHARGAIFGDVLAKILQETGHNITKEYYINDAGSQIITLVKSAYLRYLEALGEKISIGEGLYPGEYLIPVGQYLKERYQNSLKEKSEDELIDLIRDEVVEQMVKMIKSDLKEVGIVHDTLFSERKNLHLTGKIEEAIELVKNKGFI